MEKSRFTSPRAGTGDSPRPGILRRMILAGIDEAGYGPVLGPLVVGCCAFEISKLEAEELSPEAADDPFAALPCIWKRLRRHVSRSRSKDGRKLQINDSKVVYAPSAGLKELERSVLALAASAEVWDDDCDGLSSLLARVSTDAKDLPGYAWYQQGEDERFPICQEALSIRLLAKGLRQEMSQRKAYCRHLSVRVLFERQLNRMFDLMRNKAEALFCVSATHLDYLLRTFGQQELVIMCDRLGGRAYYGPALRLMFDDWSLEILAETDGVSDYALVKDGHRVLISFREKAEARCLSVAAASMVSKYLREAMMSRFNLWWQQHLPGLEPTAGYWADGNRFLRDIQMKRAELGVTDEQLVRSR